MTTNPCRTLFSFFKMASCLSSASPCIGNSELQVMEDVLDVALEFQAMESMLDKPPTAGAATATNRISSLDTNSTGAASCRRTGAKRDGAAGAERRGPAEPSLKDSLPNLPPRRPGPARPPEAPAEAAARCGRRLAAFRGHCSFQWPGTLHR